MKNYNEMLSTTFLDGGNIAYVESLYDQYLENPSSVSTEWQTYFKQLPRGHDVSLEPVREHFLQLAKNPAVTVIAGTAQSKQAQVNALIDAYRTFGHRLVKLDPLNLQTIPRISELELSYHDLNDADLTTQFDAHGFAGLNTATLKDLLSALKQTYCGSLASEFMYIANTEQRKWVQEQVEKARGKLSLTAEQKKRILERLNAAEGLERYLGTKFVGQKRFSLEGGDSLIPVFDNLMNRASEQGVLETTIGMAHRGRLNVLVNVVGKSPQELFDQFAGKHVADDTYSGDVKYHSGFSSDVQTQAGVMHIALAFNPSHLEIIAPVVEGATYAKQQRHGANGEAEVLPVIIHGDAALAGQGVNMETINFSQVPGYKTGGTLHIVINNQIGFTTSQYEGRSTVYCTDLAKMVDAPVFHINGDDPEAAWFAAQLAVDFRMKFKKDVFIDLVCYRRYGHQEVDEPTGSQPIMYRAIKNLPTVRTLYAKQLLAEKIITEADDKQLETNYRNRLDAGEHVVDVLPRKLASYDIDWHPYLKQPISLPVDTKVKLSDLQKLAKAISESPADFTLQPQVAKVMEDRKKMASGELAMDWGFAENLAYASLLAESHGVRLSGEDCQRGTFSHRQAVLHDMNSNKTYTPLEHLSDKQAKVQLLNSILSEEALMAFEYGYATASPNDLVIWEGQFGDFANGAQVVIDQFIAPGEQKWKRLSAITLFLPHGYEGQGPEHSSARLERYLQLCAQDNMRVCIPTTPAQAFHMLRSQVVGKMRKPLIVMTPKSLLRHKLAVSTLQDLSEGHFQLMIPEVDTLNDAKVSRVILCAGKVYYDLLQKRRELKREDIAIIRIEQLYPFPVKEVANELKRYSQAKDIVWCQEEPHNQGAWFCIRESLEAALDKQHSVRYVGRPASASTATGYAGMHQAEVLAFLGEALA